MCELQFLTMCSFLILPTACQLQWFVCRQLLVLYNLFYCLILVVDCLLMWFGCFLYQVLSIHLNSLNTNFVVVVGSIKPRNMVQNQSDRYHEKSFPSIKTSNSNVKKHHSFWQLTIIVTNEIKWNHSICRIHICNRLLATMQWVPSASYNMHDF